MLPRAQRPQPVLPRCVWTLKLLVFVYRVTVAPKVKNPCYSKTLRHPKIKAVKSNASNPGMNAVKSNARNPGITAV